MPLFKYEGLKGNGKKSKGMINADSLSLAKEYLRKQEILIISLLELNKEKEITLNKNLLISFTRELGQLLKAGLPLYESLLTIEEKYHSHEAHPFFLDLCEGLKNGSTLSFTLKKYPKTFDIIYISMVETAEQSGSLAEIFDQLSTLLIKQQKLRKDLISSLTYPGILAIFCLIIVFSLLVFIVPSMQELFEGRTVHPLTQTVLSLSKLVREQGVTLLTTSLSLVSFLLIFSRQKKGRLFLQKFLLKIPIFKTIAIQSSLIRFCRALSILLSSGIPLVQALAISRSVMKRGLLEEVIEKAEKKVIEGEKLSAQLRESALIPSLVSRMITIAEETGEMPTMVKNIANIYDNELERNLSELTVLLQPILLLILGAIVGTVVLSILLPLTDVSSFLAN